ncbi:MAG: SUMF1/EgtB/PvdO family nonheme iron enzyme [Litorimonas sp.]
MSDWKPPHEREGVYLGENHTIRDERAPWVRWLLGGTLLLLVIGGAVWLATKVVVPNNIPNKPAQVETPEEPKVTPIKKSSDDQAWVKALETDTLEGYREYLTLFPDGKHKDDAQEQINAYDNKAWDIAEQRQTLAGYEDYLESWPEGLHASQAREKIAEIKARAEAIAKDAAERAARDAADWDVAAQNNTIDSYGRYLTKQPRGKWVDEAQKRIDGLKASQAADAASAADNQAWAAAQAANRADGYQQYLTSYPQGAHVAKAIAAIEQLKPAPGREFQDCSECPTMVSLPTGNANLGAADDEPNGRPNEKPQRPVTFTDLFAIGVHEVTFAQWGACVAGGGCNGTPSDNGWGGNNRPVINVSWSDAQAYTSWLTQKTGFNYSLPSEAQWEYAARGGEAKSLQGGSTTALCAFANGAGIESGLGWANQDCTDPASDRTLPVGTLSPNGFGVKDMIGNVAEWTLDCNTLNLRDAPTDGRADQRGSCNQRSVRGGSWFSGPSDLRFAARLMQRRGDSNDFTGFRVVRKIEK